MEYKKDIFIREYCLDFCYDLLRPLTIEDSGESSLFLAAFDKYLKMEDCVGLSAFSIPIFKGLYGDDESRIILAKQYNNGTSYIISNRDLTEDELNTILNMLYYSYAGATHETFANDMPVVYHSTWEEVIKENRLSKLPSLMDRIANEAN
jgi:hypothetical protein